MNYYICEECGQKYCGWAKGKICQKCGGQLKLISYAKYYEEHKKQNKASKHEGETSRI